MRRVVINADDFGLSPGVDRGILEAFHDGVLTSTTMLVNLPRFPEAAALAREHPELPVGVHLSLLWGPPVSEPSEVPTLLEAGGRFPDRLTTLAGRYYGRTLSLDQVKAEFRAQLLAFRRAGLTPTHVDTHKHVHCLPGVLDALAEAAVEAGVDKVRLPLERGARAAGLQAAAKRNLIRWLCRDARQRLRSHGLRSTDHFAGIGHSGVLNSAALGSILHDVEAGVTEVMCHPGYSDAAALEFSRRPPDREGELRALTDPATRAVVEAGGIELISYREL